MDGGILPRLAAPGQPPQESCPDPHPIGVGTVAILKAVDLEDGTHGLQEFRSAP